MSNRMGWIDSLKGLGIILVVWGHLNIPLEAKIIIYSFHMPLFFFISGYLFKTKSYTFSEYIVKKAKNLLIPYLFFALISLPFGIAFDFFTSGKVVDTYQQIQYIFYLNGSVGWNSPLWFLVSLFIVEVIYFKLNNLGPSKKFVFGLILILGYGLHCTRIAYPLGVHILPNGIIFFMLGHKFREKALIEKISLKFIVSFFILLSFNIVFSIILNERVSVYQNV